MAPMLKQVNRITRQRPVRFPQKNFYEILIIDDCLANRRALRVTFEREGFQVFEARTVSG
jgi:PleD family two-component response regulator